MKKSVFAAWPYVIIALVAMLTYRFVWLGDTRGDPRAAMVAVGIVIAVVTLGIDLFFRSAIEEEEEPTSPTTVIPK